MAERRHYKKSVTMTNKRITAIGGIFFRSEQPEQTKEWYANHLGMNTDAYGSCFGWFQMGQPGSKGFTQWSVIRHDETELIPEGQQFMINYRVEALEPLVEQLRAEGVVVLDEIANYDYGKFVHILDGDGKKVELWEPNDAVFETYVEGLTF